MANEENGWFLRFMLRNRVKRRSATLCRRRSDGTLWAASSPQDAGMAMRGLFTGKSSWHFVKVRKWRGINLVSRKTFWSFSENGQFDILGPEPACWLPAWPSKIETTKLSALPNV